MTNGKPKDTYVPSDVHLGGQRTSASQLRTAANCWQKFFLSYLAPHPTVPDGAGLRSRIMEAPLMTGAAVHRGLHFYFLSGWKDGGDTGQRNLMGAKAHAEEYLRSVREHATSEPKWEESLKHTNRCLDKFDDYLANGLVEPLTVVDDGEGEPMLERELLVPLAEGRFLYVDKIDALFDNAEGFRQVGEYKTSAANSVNAARLGLGLTAQTLGHLTCLFVLAPDQPLHGSRHIILVKNRGDKNKVDPHIYVENVLVPQENLSYYKQLVEQMLESIVDRAITWDNQCREGWNPYQAGMDCFPLTGIMSGACKAYNRMCEFAGYCEAHGYGERMLQGFKPRTIAGAVVEEKEEEMVTSAGEVF